MRIRHRDLLWQNRTHLLWGSLLLIVTDLIVFIFPLIVKWVIDRLSGEPLPTWLEAWTSHLSALEFSIWVCGLLTFLSVLSYFFRYYWRVHIVWSFFPLIHNVRHALFLHLSRLRLSFFRKQKSGDLLSTLSEDTEKLRLTVSFGTLAVIDTVINFLIFPWMLFWLSPEITLYVLPFLILSSLLLVILSDRLSLIYEKIQDQIGQISARAFEIAGGVRVIKAFAREKDFTRRFRKDSKELADTSVRLAYFESAFMPGLQFVIGAAMAFVLIYGGIKVFQNEWAVSSLVAYQLYLGKLDWPVVAVGWFTELYRRSRASLVRINKLFEFEAPKGSKVEPALDFSKPSFELQHLSFSYNPGRLVLRDLNFRLEAGKTIGLTGPVGAGKSSLLHILSGQERDFEGSVKFYGQELNEFSDEFLEERIVYIPQDVFLFSKSIRDNLQLGLTSKMSDMHLEELLERLRFDIASLRDRGGLWTRLGERGLNVSGGQKQRLAIGRSLLRNRQVYLFDDVFSHLDAETEAELLELLRSKMPDNACLLLVSQRLETLSQLDEVLVLVDGELEFKGNFSEGRKQSAFLNRLEFLQRKYRSVS